MNFIDELRNRNILNNITNEEKFLNLPKGSAVYIGFDPSADSLHLGNYIQISILKQFVKHGYKAIAVIGGATGMIGDPSGKSSERNLLDETTLDENKAKIVAQLKSFDLEVVDNKTFYENMNVLDFLRGPGKMLNVNYMINKEVVKSRLESGISFTEFSYQLIQGWDFKMMNEKHNVMIQVGGSDQWGNITAGIEVIRKSNEKEVDAVGITTNLLTTSSGKKFGKSESGALFLSADLTSPFEVYQYLLNLSDDDSANFLKWISMKDLSEIDAVIAKHKENPSERLSQKTLAEEILTDIHNAETVKDCVALTEILFGSGSAKDLTADQFKLLETFLPSITASEINILDALVETTAASSKREAREFVEGGAVEVNGEIIKDESFEISNKSTTIIRRGKKKYFLIKS